MELKLRDGAVLSADDIIDVVEQTSNATGIKVITSDMNVHMIEPISEFNMSKFQFMAMLLKDRVAFSGRNQAGIQIILEVLRMADNEDVIDPDFIVEVAKVIMTRIKAKPSTSNARMDTIPDDWAKPVSTEVASAERDELRRLRDEIERV